MKLEIGKVKETHDWKNIDFSSKYVKIGLVGEEHPFRNKNLLGRQGTDFGKGMFEGLPYLAYKPDPKIPKHTFKLMPVIAVDRRYTFYFVKIEKPELISEIEMINALEF